VPLSQENSINSQKLTPTLCLPNATKTNPPKKSMSVCCVYTTTAAATKTNPPKKKQSGRMTGWIKGCSVCCVCTTAVAATKTNPLKKSLPLCVVCVLPLLLPQKQTHPKKRRSVWMTGRI